MYDFFNIKIFIRTFYYFSQCIHFKQIQKPCRQQLCGKIYDTKFFSRLMMMTHKDMKISSSKNCVSLKMHSKNTFYDSRINRKCLYAPLTPSGRQAGIPSFIHACWHTIRLPSSLRHQQQQKQQQQLMV